MIVFGKEMSEEQIVLLEEVWNYMLHHEWYQGLPGSGWQLVNKLIKEKYFIELEHVPIKNAPAFMNDKTDTVYEVTLRGLWFYFLLKKNLL
jgi:hypothetical protein